MEKGLHMPMTENELADLDKLLLRLEKKAKGWTWGRWMNVVLSFLLLGVAAWILTMQVPDAWRAMTSRDFIAPINASDLWRARGSTMYLCLGYGLAAFFGLCGGIAMTHTLCHWRKGHHDLLLVKMARAWLESQQAVPPSAP